MAQPQRHHTPTNTAATLPARTGFPNTPPRSSVQQHSLITTVGLHLIPGACLLLFYVLVAPLLILACVPPVWGLLLGTLLIIVPLAYAVWWKRTRHYHDLIMNCTTMDGIVSGNYVTHSRLP